MDRVENCKAVHFGDLDSHRPSQHIVVHLLGDVDGRLDNEGPFRQLDKDDSSLAIGRHLQRQDLNLFRDPRMRQRS